MYVDDILVMCRAYQREAIAVRSCFDKYFTWSGQEANVTKSSMLFSGNTKVNDKRAIKEIMIFSEMRMDAVYLGNSFVFSCNKTKEFMKMKEKISNLLEGWNSQTLSKVRKVTMIKNVTQVIPVYTLSTFKISVGACNAIDSVVKSFWSRKPGLKKYTAWKNWTYVCKHRCPMSW